MLTTQTELPGLALPPGSPSVREALAHLSRAFTELDGAAGALGGLEHSSALELREEVVGIMRRVHGLRLLLADPPGS